MTSHVAPEKTVGQLALLFMALCLAVSSRPSNAQSSLPNSHQAQSSHEKRAFETISIHANEGGNASYGIWKVFPNALRIRNQVVFGTVMLAYSSLPRDDWRNDQLTGVPFWTEGYDIDAIVDSATAERWKDMSDAARLEDAKLMLRTMLAERYGLKLHSATKEVSTFALVAGKHTASLTPAKTLEKPPAGFFAFPEGGGWSGIPPKPVNFYSTSMESLAQFLSRTSPYPIENRTGLSGKYDFELATQQEVNTEPSDPRPPSKFDLDPLGLKLIPTKKQVAIQVVDHIEKPSAN